jgi:arsenate reductase
MAHGFLQSFDNRLKVYSAGTEASGKVNPNAIRVMREAGVDISHHTSESVGLYLGMEWDYVITVCGGANENCPVFSGSVRHRIHMGYDDPSDATGTEEFISGEYIRVRNEIRVGFRKLYEEELKQQL